MNLAEMRMPARIRLTFDPGRRTLVEMTSRSVECCSRKLSAIVIAEPRVLTVDVGATPSLAAKAVAVEALVRYTRPFRYTSCVPE